MIVQESPGLRYKVVYTSSYYNFIDLKIYAQKLNGPGSFSFFRLKTYYEFLMVTPGNLKTMHNKPVFIYFGPTQRSHFYGFLDTAKPMV